ncbi:TetR/AcrR family transcriptional regulator C-terminal domain-containing protein [Pseudonocardia oroxyli]|uniref:AefR-like transcriptional repressor, C-terminal region n=1 Tax=Pseudonocardia oroxyli TaxID=366584 RepID=A0A1G7E3J6_PSEOR|nr:TetR/AcrR family transcriptional regulator C-terminal domain-containing protein [Pseudonocardia oroxyli]SDE58277.1 AefR-like transcriptional repressor, C-terminal region [Pseudonocardia oroxyli]
MPSRRRRARLLALSVGGHLRISDPAVAEHLGSLLTGGLDGRTRFGTRPLSEAELAEISRTAVDTFLRAFGPG